MTSVACHIFLLGSVLALTGCASGRSASAADSPKDEVPVGYGTQDRRNITGSVQSLETEDLTDVRAARVEELMEGRFAGVQVVRTPSGNFSLRIRGTSSIMGNNEPLFVIDGVPVHSGSGGALMGINPRDIARIEVLKDAGSTAIYGSRGANGVVLITTKRAR